MTRLTRTTTLHLALLLSLMGLMACSGDGDGGASTGGGGAADVGSDAGATDSATTDTASAHDASTTEDAGKPACQKGTVTALGKGFFVDISAASGIQQDNVILGSAKAIPINDHSRLGFVDLDGDGLDDIVTHSLYPNPQKGIPFEHLVYRNKGDGTFEHISDSSGLRKVQAGFLAFGDVDNDGDQDCFAGLDIPITGKTHLLLLNDGKGHFTVKANSGVESIPPIAGNAVFADFNGDAKLDLFIGLGHTSYKAPNRLLLGNGDGTFTDKTSSLNDGSSQPTNGSMACDYDNDGDLDIFVSNYGVSVAAGHNRLLQNDGNATFSEVGKAAGWAYQESGNSWLVAKGTISGPEPKPGAVGFIGSNGFGIDCGDINGDGFLDVFATAISHPNAGNYSRTWSDPTQVLIASPTSDGVRFTNEATARKFPFNEGDVDGALVDFDNDGRLDASVSRDKKYEASYTTLDQKAWFGLMRQLPDGTFQSIGPDSGINDVDYKAGASLSDCTSDGQCSNGEKCLSKRCRQPCADHGECKTAGESCHSGGFCKALLKMKSAQNHGWSDIDGDGDLDLLVGGRDTGGGRPNFLFRNDAGHKLPSLMLRLIGDGKAVNRDAIGGRAILVHKAGGSLLREVKSSRGMHNSMDTRWLHFGLGDAGCDYSVTVRWPDGKTVVLDAALVAAGARYDVTYPDKVTAWAK